MTSPPTPRLLLALLLALAAQASLTGPATAQPEPESAPGMPELARALDRPDLQAVVDFQTRRDTAALVRLLGDHDAAIRARAALALGSVRAPRAVPALADLLDDPHADVRAFAAFAMGQGEGVAAVAPLLDALHREDDHTVLSQLMHAIGRVGDRPALAALATAEVPAAVEHARALAIARLGIREVHDPAAIRLLAGQLEAEDAHLRRNAAYYFGRITDASAWQDHVDAVARASASLAPEDEAQLFLVTALGRLGSREHEDSILRLLQESRDWRIRVNAARALTGKWRSEEATAALMGAFDDPSHHVATAAAAAVAAGELTPAQLDHLEAWRAVRGGEWHVWAAFLPALAAAGRLEAITDALDGDLPLVGRAAAVRALGLDDTPAGLRQLADAAAHAEPRLAAAAVEALRQRWQRKPDRARATTYFETFTEALRRGEGAVVSAAAPALSDSLFLDMGAGEVLRETYAQLHPTRNVGPMEAIVRAHGIARDTAALDFMVDVAVTAQHPVLRQAAVEALTERFGEGFLFTTLGGHPPDFPEIDWSYLAQLGHAPRLVLETEYGTIVLELHTEWAPATVQAITRFARDARYDGVEFHRVVPNFVIQGGDFGAGDGFGGPDFVLPSEFTPLPYRTGTLGMASSGPDTEGSQFFVTHSMQPHLDGRYTVFGRVLSGQRVVDQIRAGDRVLTARVEESR